MGQFRNTTVRATVKALIKPQTRTTCDHLPCDKHREEAVVSHRNGLPPSCAKNCSKASRCPLFHLQRRTQEIHLLQDQKTSLQPGLLQGQSGPKGQCDSAPTSSHSYGGGLKVIVKNQIYD